MRKQRFRNHFFSVFQNVIPVFTILIGVGLNIYNNIIEGKQSMDEIKSELTKIIVGAFVFFIIIFLWKIRVWYKTWIVIEDGTISMERNTVFFKKNTIGIGNISNVNLEQTIIGRLFGICNLKINTNSFSTADTTDMKLTLKKDDANALKEEILAGMAYLNGEEVSNNDIEMFDFVSEPRDIIMNTVYSVRYLTLLTFFVFFGSIISFISMVIEGENLLFSSGIIILINIVIFGCWITYQGICYYLKYAEFATKRTDNKIYIRYGKIKRVEYSIPVEKVNGIVIRQTFMARIFKKYSAELINVGMGDEEKEKTFFCLYCSLKQLQQILKILLPEYSDAIEFHLMRQPKMVWVLKIKNLLFFTMIFGGIFFSVKKKFDEVPVGVGIYGWIVAVFFILLAYYLSYMVKGATVKNHYFNDKEGIFGTKHMIVHIDKIQHISIKSNVLTKKLGICRGGVHILAKMDQSYLDIPYCKQEEMDALVENCRNPH
ncbi:MAG: PH domain-containing protein [Eubacterium sp.]|nr:PH domain-containing protein [Eubacterium sp.]